MCEQVGEDRVCVSKLCVNKLAGGGGGGRRRRDTEPKTRTPHKDVGNEMDEQMKCMKTMKQMK